MRNQGLCLLVLLVTTTPGWSKAREEETILGKPSGIQPATESEEIVEIPAGTRLRERPLRDSAIVEILDFPLGLPILDRQGSWVQVRFGAWLAWVRIDGDAPDESLAAPRDPDGVRLERALHLLGPHQPGSLGPFTLYTDIAEPALLDRLSAVASNVVVAYRLRYGLDPGEAAGEAVVIYAREDSYRRFEAAETGIAVADSQGFTNEGLSVLYAGDQPEDAILSVLIHELTHLLSRRIFLSEIPPWLDEGLAQDLAWCRIGRKGQIRLGTVSSLDTHVDVLLQDWDRASRPHLLELLSLDPESFVEPAGRTQRYTESAFLVRYLLDSGNAQLKSGFLRYLSQLTTSELTDSVSLFAALNSEPGKIEMDLFRFLTSQARAHGIS